MNQILSCKCPTSKSLTQRYLIISALAHGESSIREPLVCDDSKTMCRALTQLGISVDTHSAHQWKIRGGTVTPSSLHIDCGEAGTVARFLAPFSLIAKGHLNLTGAARLKERPMLQQIRALETLGVEVIYQDTYGYLPLCLQNNNQIVNQTTVEANQSSQFVSGLLMVAPLLPQGLTITIAHDTIASLSYISMTVQAMNLFGITVKQIGTTYIVPHAQYSPCDISVEGDWSAAAFLLVGSWITKRPVNIPNVSQTSSQADKKIVDFLRAFETPKEYYCFDLLQCPDLIAPLAVASVFAQSPVRITNVGNCRLKESDRVSVLCEEMKKRGVPIVEKPDAIHINPGAKLSPGMMDPHNDHRMAMAFGLLSLVEPGIHIKNPSCVNKSYSQFWQDLEIFR